MHDPEYIAMHSSSEVNCSWGIKINAPHTDKLEPREAGKKLQKIHCCQYLLNQAIPLLSIVPPTNDLSTTC